METDLIKAMQRVGRPAADFFFRSLKRLIEEFNLDDTELFLYPKATKAEFLSFTISQRVILCTYVRESRTYFQIMLPAKFVKENNYEKNHKIIQFKDGSGGPANVCLVDFLPIEFFTNEGILWEEFGKAIAQELKKPYPSPYPDPTKEILLIINDENYKTKLFDEAYSQQENYDFSWVPFFEEISEKLKDYKGNHAGLIDILNEIGIVEGMTDEEKPGIKIKLRDIDPLTFMAYINKFGTVNRKKYCERLKEKWNLTSKSPTGFDGVPMPQAQNLWPWGYEWKRTASAIERLWRLFELIHNENWTEAKITFTEALSEYNSGYITLIQYTSMVFPTKFFPIASWMNTYLEEFGIKQTKAQDWDSYQELLGKINTTIGEPYWLISARGYTFMSKRRALNTSIIKEPETAVNDPIISYPEGIRYYWINANPTLWRITDYNPGEIQTYSTHNNKGNKRKIYSNYEQIQPGDLIIGYETTPTRTITSLLELTQGRHEDENGDEIIEFKILKHFTRQPNLEELRQDPEIKGSNPLNSSQGSLFALTEKEFKAILSLTEPQKATGYSKADLIQEVFISEPQLNRILALLNRKKNIILQGPPGTGKTFFAKRLAYCLMGEKDQSRVQTIQFHQSYSYEDFIQGYRPTDTGLKLKNGLFYEFARLASRDNRPYLMIIDEVNRGNLSKIFGELMMLLEADKRGESLQLAYSTDMADLFTVPDNLYIIGTMNTADRSLALVDYALRRRFAFINMHPVFDDLVITHLTRLGLSIDFIKSICLKFNNLNRFISDDPSLGPGFQIGHSYFITNQVPVDEEDWLNEVLTFEILPLLEEYWFDNEERLSDAKTIIGLA